MVKKCCIGCVSILLLNDIKEGQVFIVIEGKVIGKVNGLMVMDIGDMVFGMLVWIIVMVYVGVSGVVDIEREVELGQLIYLKGVMLFIGYFGNKYVQVFLLIVFVNIVLE